MAVLLTLASCATTARAVKPGKALKADAGYVAIRFIKKLDTMSFGLKKVYSHLRHTASGANIYIPFGFGGELRLIELAPGDYRLQDFVYMTGMESTRYDAAAEEPGVYYGKPERGGSTLDIADFPQDWCKDFKVNAGEIVYLGDYSYKSKFAFSGAAVTVERSFEKEGFIAGAIYGVHPDSPESLVLASLE